MKWSLRTKLILSYFALASFTGIVIFLLIFLTSDQRLKSLLEQEQQAEIIEEVQTWYQAEKSWLGFANYFDNLHPKAKNDPKRDKREGKKNKKHKTSEGKPKPPKPSNMGKSPYDPDSRINQYGILDADKRVIVQFLTFKAGDIPPEAYLNKIIPIELDNLVIAWLVPKDAKGISLKSEKKIFFEHTNQILLIAVLISLLVATLLGVILAKYLLQPIEALTKASHAMAQGDLKQSIVNTSHDELGDLADSFNKMSDGLAKADTQRRQMTADIAHDLGTPLQVISGYIEMAQELNKPLDQDKLSIINTEINHIKRLLSDLSILSDADKQTLSVICQPVAISSLFERVQSAYKAQCALAQVTLVVHLDTHLPDINLDEERMVQVLGNLINNALRYTDKEGEISLSVRREDRNIVMEVRDNGLGIEAKHLPFIFDRFYRVSDSRSNETGNMGLGLSISKALVELQHASIGVTSAGIGKGSCFKICFPNQF